jgi:uncharacterized ParB-like nuclease family protein
MISIVQQPPEVTPIYNDIVMTVVSDKIITKFKNKYVFDIFGSKQNNDATPNSNPIYLGRVKSTPNPSGYGMLDLSRYLQTILGPEMNETPDTRAVNGTPDTRIVESSSGTYYIVCGEEYSDTENGPVTLYNGNGTVSSGTTLTSTISQTMFMFNGVNQFAEGLVFDATDYFQPTGRRLLTNSPRTLYKETDEYINLSAFSGYYSGSTTQANYNIPLRASVYNSAGSLIKTYVGNSSGLISNSVNKSMKMVNSNIETIVSGFTGTWNKIDILLGTLTGSTSGTTETLTVYRKDCPWQKYDPVDVMFLNRLGGWDFFRFFGSKDEDVKIERGTYQRQYGTWSSINFSYNTNERGTSNIKTDLTLQGEVMSDFLDIDTVNWLEELLTSPEVFILGEEYTVNTSQYRKLIPISVTDSNFKRQVRGNRKLRQVSFKYQYSNQIRTQQLGR